MLKEQKTRREELLVRALQIFGTPGDKKSENIWSALTEEQTIDYVEYTDEMLKNLLNDVVFDKTTDNLFTKYVVPPFSVLDTKSGYWQHRRNAWLQLTGNLTATKEGVLAEGMMSKINGGSSNFDPVLAEVLIKWFNLPHGKILDPFGGEQTKGIVAGILKMPYWGCEVRQEQVDYNAEMSKELEDVNYVCGDSRKIEEHIQERNFDFVITSPPYYDLEIYSENKDDISTFGTFEDFMSSMYEIYQSCVNMLNEDRFFVVKVGEIRDKKTGIYRNFVSETISALESCGLNYYNEIILLNNPGTAPMRAGNTFSTRKIVKLHQNILVFYKGDVKNIPKIFTSINEFNPMPVLEQASLF